MTIKGRGNEAAIPQEHVFEFGMMDEYLIQGGMNNEANT